MSSIHLSPVCWAAAQSGTRVFRGVRPLTTLVAGLSALLLLSACEAQKPGASTSSTIAAKSSEARPYSEPALIGKVIDQTTLKPIAGAFVYGHYMTAGGTLAGGTVAQDYVRNFVVETDNEGVFKLEAWNNGERKIAGITGDRFPMLAIWKPGYEPEFLGLASIAQFQPRVYMPTTVGADGRLWVTDPNGKTYRYEKVEPDTTTIPNTIDWRATGFMLNPVKDELARYNALANSGRAMVMFGDCGWEPYAKVLLAQHGEWKRWYAANIPQDQLDLNGYPRATFRHDRIATWGISMPTYVDQLIDANQKANAQWKCIDPSKAFNLTGAKK